MDKTNPSKWTDQVIRFIVLPDDDEDAIIYKKVWLELASSAFILGLTLLIVCMANHFHALSILAGVFVFYFLVAGILSLQVKRQIHVFF